MEQSDGLVRRLLNLDSVITRFGSIFFSVSRFIIRLHHSFRLTALLGQVLLFLGYRFLLVLVEI